ncbi:MAG: dual specificity protein phosphatase family protein, partial [Planctomycetes bacterium]|nr:dual specificity protein phosphatase family protein [Planctomycetota bacterium]
ALMIRHHRRYKHLVAHEEGMMYRSAWLEPDALAEVIEKYQIRTVVNLCNPGEMGEERWVKEREAVTNSGARLIELSMPLSVDPSDPQIARQIAVLNSVDNYPMLVHCQHGVTRTAKFLAIYDIIYRGKTADESLTAQPLFGRKEHNVNVRAFVNNFEKEHRRLYPAATAERLKVLRR